MPSFLRQLLTYLGFYPRSPSGTCSQSPSQATAISPVTQQTDALQYEIRAQRKFSLAEAIGREGGSFMKGESLIPRPLRATTAINQFIVAHLKDPTSALSVTLQAWAKDDIRLARQLDSPLVALTQIIEGILNEPTTLGEFARQVAIAHSQLTGDQAIFAKDTTHEPIKADLLVLLAQLQQQP
jgi:hypothetical protein